MLGRHHLALTFLTAATLLAPFLGSFYALATLLGVSIGSLIPDSDAPNSMIYQRRVSALGGQADDLINRYFAPFFPVFGYTTKYLIYLPSVLFYRALGLEVEEKHRGLMHSVLGVATATALTGIYAGVFLFLTGLYDFYTLGFFLAGYVFGALMHLLEDSLTVSGVTWLYPFNDSKLCGGLKTTSRPEDARVPNLFSYFLLGLFASVYTLKLEVLNSAIFSASSLILVWAVFIWFNGLSLER